MISPRYLPALCVLFALAVVPTWIHSYSGEVAVDGRVTSAISTSLLDYRGVAGDRNETWGKRRFDSDDWVERQYTSGNDGVRLTVIRSYDLKSLYHHPELAVAYGTSFAGQRTERLPTHPGIPVHVLVPGAGSPAAGLYVLHYDDRFVEEPLIFQLRIAGELLFSHRKPMTIFFVLDPSAPEAANIESLGASRLLLAAIDSFLQQKIDTAAAAR